MVARILIEARINQEFPDYISFENERGVMMTQDVKYEWKPIKCEQRHGIGHIMADCKLKKQLKRSAEMDAKTKGDRCRRIKMGFYW